MIKDPFFVLGTTFAAKQPPVIDPLSTSPLVWLDAKDPSTFTLVGNRLSQWDDKSGNDRHATAGTLNRPMVSSKQGLPGVTLFDSSTVMSLPTLSLPIGDNPYTIMFAGNMNSFSNGAVIIGDNVRTTTNERLFYVIESAHARLGWWANNIIGPDVELDTVTVSATDYETGAQRHSYDNTNSAVATDTPGTRISTATGITLFFASEGNRLDGFIHELLVWDYVLSDIVRGQMINRLNGRWVPQVLDSKFDSDVIPLDSTFVTFDEN